MKYRVLMLSMLFVLPSCGWQLRDTQLVPSTLGTLYLSSSDRNSALITELQRALNINGIKVIGNKAVADYSVIIVDHRQSSRTASINPSGRVAEYQLNEDVDFIITDAQGNEMIPLSTASVERVYEFNEDDILSSTNESRSVRNRMHEEIVRQILNRLRIFSDNAAP
ncbi:MAG: hypothetical protein EVB03_03660 [SAR92 clade bacterium]|uniref:LPS-assembly lipoprotein LptE n=1 Tax=SAR92 clade bacterium TaxID=2315479 RepID=A0A520MHV9_9GAMM|nr:MAG: hypothetical protein EVB03_03660 [SAR92 clade bacterium]